MAKEYVELIRCKDCEYFDGQLWCHLLGHGIGEDDYCSRAERKRNQQGD